MIRVLIADDQALARDGITAVLQTQPDLEVVGQAGDGRNAVQMARRLHPDVAMLDIRMPLMDGIQATSEILGSCPTTSVLILTTFDLDEYVYAALKAGASGFLLKDAERGQIVEAVRSVAKGSMLLAPTVTRRLVDRFVSRHGPDQAAKSRLADLTERETEVLKLVAKGNSNAEIAAHLRIGEATVKTHVGRLLMKLGLRDRIQVVIFAYESRLI
ncbi:MAG: response regulator transcription factor [Candidatus Dormibacteraeota bacterium]|nr:response regulator transcription factor [Candidatus Dormibacteraeota bacterium]